MTYTLAILFGVIGLFGYFIDDMPIFIGGCIGMLVLCVWLAALDAATRFFTKEEASTHDLELITRYLFKRAIRKE